MNKLSTAMVWPAGRRTLWARYVAAVAAACLALALRLALDPYLENFEPFGTFYLAVAFAAWWSGWQPALVVVVIGYLAGDWFFIPPRHSLGVSEVRGLVHLLTYFFVTITTVVLMNRLRGWNRALQRARDELAHANAVLEETVQDRTARLRQTVGELDRFSYAIMHDMRAPLRSMQGFADLLEREYGPGLDERARRYFQRITTSARRMDNLIVDALNYTKTLRDELPLAPVDVFQLLRGMLESYPDLQPPGIEVQVAPDIPKVIGNEAGLTQCFSNLLSNAAKFVAPGSRPQVKIWAEQRGELVRLWVEDNGIGIEPRYHKQIFGIFHRLQREGDSGGTGMGLAIVQKAMERMGGSVGVESEPGQGSRFWLELKAAGKT